MERTRADQSLDQKASGQLPAKPNFSVLQAALKLYMGNPEHWKAHRIDGLRYDILG
jgi:hypothetical protein